MLTALVRTQTKEDFLHFAVCLQRLLSALGTLQVIKASPDHPLAVPAFRFALVEYSMPYTDSRGSEKPYYKLKDSYVPKEHLALHKKILEARHTLHAHADLTVMSAKVFVTKTRGMPSATVSGQLAPSPAL